MVVDHLLDYHEAVATGLREAGAVEGAVGARVGPVALALDSSTWKV